MPCVSLHVYLASDASLLRALSFLSGIYRDRIASARCRAGVVQRRASGERRERAHGFMAHFADHKTMYYSALPIAHLAFKPAVDLRRLYVTRVSPRHLGAQHTWCCSRCHKHTHTGSIATHHRSHAALSIQLISGQLARVAFSSVSLSRSLITRGLRSCPYRPSSWPPRQSRPCRPWTCSSPRAAHSRSRPHPAACGRPSVS